MSQNRLEKIPNMSSLFSDTIMIKKMFLQHYVMINTKKID